MLARRSLLFASVVLLGCSADGPAGSGSPGPNYVGRVVSVHEDPSGYRSFYVNRDTSDSSENPQNLVTLHFDHPASGPTLVRWADGRFARWDDIAVGQMASVWTSGIEMRSLPPQAHANLVSIQSR